MPLSAIIIVFEGLEGTFSDKKTNKKHVVAKVVQKVVQIRRYRFWCPNGVHFVSQGVSKGLPKSQKVDKNDVKKLFDSTRGPKVTKGVPQDTKMTSKWYQNDTKKG